MYVCMYVYITGVDLKPVWPNDVQCLISFVDHYNSALHQKKSHVATEHVVVNNILFIFIALNFRSLPSS